MSRGAQGGGGVWTCLKVSRTFRYVQLLKDYRHQFLKYVRNCGVPSEGICKIMGTVLGKYFKINRREIKH